MWETGLTAVICLVLIYTHHGMRGIGMSRIGIEANVSIVDDRMSVTFYINAVDIVYLQGEWSVVTFQEKTTDGRERHLVSVMMEKVAC